MRALRILTIAGLALALTACQDSGTKQTVGTVLGGVGGAVAGTAIGTLVGAFLGSEIGKSLDKADQAAAQRATQSASTAPIGQKITWSNPDTGNSGAVTPTREGRDTSGAQCREYHTTVNVGGKQEEAYGTACRQADGTWKFVN
jgi:surface antigen